jgi:hypothetical protein
MISFKIPDYDFSFFPKDRLTYSDWGIFMILRIFSGLSKETALLGSERENSSTVCSLCDIDFELSEIVLA